MINVLQKIAALPFLFSWIYFKISIFTQPYSLSTSLLNEHLVPHILSFFFCVDGLNILASCPEVCVELSMLETHLFCSPVSYPQGSFIRDTDFLYFLAFSVLRYGLAKLLRRSENGLVV